MSGNITDAEFKKLEQNTCRLARSQGYWPVPQEGLAEYLNLNTKFETPVKNDTI